MKRLAANLTNERFVILVFLNVPYAVVFPDELSSAVVTRVWPHAFVRVHMCNVIGLSNEGTLTLIALEGLGCATGVRPLMQLKIPFSGEILVANQARERPLSAVLTDVYFQGRSEISTFADGALNVFVIPVYLREKLLVMGTTHMSR